MVMCNYCGDYFHVECVSISKEALSVKHYKSPPCFKGVTELLYDEGNLSSLAFIHNIL